MDTWPEVLAMRELLGRVQELALARRDDEHRARDAERARDDVPDLGCLRQRAAVGSLADVEVLGGVVRVVARRRALCADSLRLPAAKGVPAHAVACRAERIVRVEVAIAQGVGRREGMPDPLFERWEVGEGSVILSVPLAPGSDVLEVVAAVALVQQRQVVALVLKQHISVLVRNHGNLHVILEALGEVKP